MQHEEKFIKLMNAGDEPSTKRDAKASVFTDVFGMPAYGLELLKTLHPELTDYTVDDISTVTIRNILTNKSFNDLGILARDTFVILVEAQSTWSENILVRILIYLAYTYKNYIIAHELDVYDEKRLSLPKPEFYVIYTGTGKHPDRLSFSETFFPGEKLSVEITADVLRGGNEGNVIDQYVEYAHELDRNIQKYGRGAEAARATVQYCIEHNVLREYFVTRGMEEVVNLMMTLFDDETIMRNHDANVRRQGMAEGMAKGIAKGEVKGEKRLGTLISRLISAGRVNDASRAASDPEYREKLYAEMGIV